MITNQMALHADMDDFLHNVKSQNGQDQFDF